MSPQAPAPLPLLRRPQPPPGLQHLPRDIVRFWREEVVFLSSCHLASTVPLMAPAPSSYLTPLPQESLLPGNHCEGACHCWALPGPGPFLNPVSAPVLQVELLGPDRQQARSVSLRTSELRAVGQPCWPCWEGLGGIGPGPLLPPGGQKPTEKSLSHLCGHPERPHRGAV